MSLVVPNSGLLADLGETLAAWGNTLLCALYQNDVTITPVVPYAAFAQADFSGYLGPRSVQTWVPASLFGNRAVSSATPIPFVHNGGATANWIFGYIVFDPMLILRWAETLPAPVLLRVSGESVMITPKFSRVSQF